MAGRVLELRVHGVSNTPPAEILGLRTRPGGSPAQPRLVAGDATTGFYRPRTDPAEPPTVEAYSWGQLTSGARTAKDIRRALWTFLLPFTLANVALYARPEIPADPRRERLISRTGLNAWLVRIFCLSLTGTLVLSVTGVAVDLIAWQCVDEDCLSQVPGPWEFLASGWWGAGARPLAVGLLVPLAVLAVVGLLSWRTYQYEAEMPSGPAEPDDRPQLDHPLQDADFWCGEGQVRRLAMVHLTAGATIAAMVPLGAVLAMDPPQGTRAMLTWGVLGLLGTVVLLGIGTLGHPYTTRKGGRSSIRPYGLLLSALAALGVLGTLVVLLLPDGPAGVPLHELRPSPGCTVDSSRNGCVEDRSLPGYDTILTWLAVIQVLLLIAIAGVSRSGRRALVVPVVTAVLVPVACGWVNGWLPGLPSAPDQMRSWMVAAPALAVTAAITLLFPRARTEPTPPPVDRCVAAAWGGRGPAVLAGIAWLLAISYSAGLLYWTTDRLNNGATPSGLSTITPPIPVMWAGIAYLVTLAATAGAAGHAWLILARLRRRSLAQLVPPGSALSPHERRRAYDVATYHGLHQLVGEHALGLVGRLVLVAVVLAGASAAAALSLNRPVPQDATGWLLAVKAAVDIGNSLLGLLPVLVAGLGLLVYRNDTVRRSVGVIWDIGTFWPRSAHPLAPPSYASRAVPQLQTRIAGLMALPEDDPRRADAIILSGHSQGSVICAAVILQLHARWRRRIWFFSYGSQLTRLYGRAFPAFFGPHRLPTVATALTTAPGRTYWTNFWRETDPLGWPVAAAERELRVRDPEGLHPTDGEVNDPPIRNHSGYPDSVEFHREKDTIVAMFTGTVPAPRGHPD
ncbi:hypothetical protein GCM10027280_13300 [Micromonospora polyrhachis]|uniref:Integral membrane protein n=1 Tax=Micromonospora polyrhachis TaxID=1282883 RepID=A0A7W7WQI6_9ACTN|nr:hypothetical protein [Micromonospora polyrhachis]MBB4960065.1 hypothetical protein [Micromonospora polyrhachis]